MRYTLILCATLILTLFISTRAFAQDGNWTVVNREAPQFAAMAAEAGVVPLIGDFNTDGRDDIALLRRVPGWTTLPVAFSQGDGNWNVTNHDAGSFAIWSVTAGVTPLVGDFNNDGLDDIALLRRSGGWTTVPVAFALGDGRWNITNREARQFAEMVATLGVLPLTGDFNNDGSDDIALVRQTAGWTTVPVAHAQGDGNWLIINAQVGAFADMAATPGVVPLAGDFDNDGLDDIALLRRAGGWNTVPVARKLGNGSWSITNLGDPAFTAMAATAGVAPMTRGVMHPSKPGYCTHPPASADPALVFGCSVPDFNNDGRDDIALLRQTGGWNKVPIALAQGNGRWTTTNGEVGGFAGWVTEGGVKSLVGDFNKDGQADIAAVRQAPGWKTVPVALALGGIRGNWNVTNADVSDFAGMAAMPGVAPLVGDFNNDGQDDIALLRQTSGWASVPIAFADTGRVSILTYNPGGLEPKGEQDIKWEERFRRLVAWVGAESSAPDIFAITELWGWWRSDFPWNRPVKDYDAIDKLLWELQKQVHIEYRVAFSTGTANTTGWPNKEYWTQTVLYNPARLTNLTARDLGNATLLPHDSQDAAAYLPHLRRSLPLCERGTTFMQLQRLIDGPMRAEKCNQPTPTGPAWAVLWKGGPWDGILASYVRFELKRNPGQTLDAYVLHLRYANDQGNWPEIGAQVSNAFYDAMEGPHSSSRRYPPIVSGDFNGASPLNPKFPESLTYLADAPPGAKDDFDVIGTSIGSRDAFPALCKGRFAVKRTIPSNLTPGMECGGPPDRLVSDHCATFVSIEPDGACN